MLHFRYPEIGSWGWEKPDWWHCCHRVGPSVYMTQDTWPTVSQSTYLNPSTHQPPPLQSPIYHHLILFFSNSFWTFALQIFFFYKKNVSTKDTKTPNCFCKTWIAWYSFFLVVVLIWKTFLKPRKKSPFCFWFYFQTERCRSSSFLQSVQSLINDSRVKVIVKTYEVAVLRYSVF